MYCIVLRCVVLYFIVVCIVYSARESKSPAVAKNRKIRAKAFYHRVSMGDGGSVAMGS